MPEKTTIPLTSDFRFSNILKGTGDILSSVGKSVGGVVEQVFPGIKSIRESVQQRSLEPEKKFLMGELQKAARIPTTREEKIEFGFTAAGFITPDIKEISSLEKVTDVLKSGQKIIQQEQKASKPLIQKIATEFYDKFQPIGKFVTEVEKQTGRKLSAEENAYIGARMYAGVSGKIENKLGELGEILNENREHVKSGNLSKYLFAERLLERSKNGFENPGGITKEEATQAIEAMKSVMGNSFQDIQKSAAKVYQYTDTLLEKLREGGIIDEETFNSIKSKNQKYVPFDVIHHLIENEEIIPSGQKSFSVASQDVIKKTKGTLREVDDPLNAIVRKTIKVMDIVERNKVARKLVDSGQEVEGLVKKLGKEELIEKGAEKINVFENGIKNSYQVPKGVGESMKRLTAKQVDIVTHVASFGSRALRAGATSLNAAFIIPNALRDFETATLVSKNGFNIVDWGKGFLEALKPSLKELGFPIKDEVYQEYLKSAGKIGGYYSTYLNDIPKTVDELIQPQFKKTAKILLNPLRLIEEIGSIIERTPRLGVFMKALSKGESPTAAGFASRESTVDFSKSGEIGRIVNMWVPFLNARLQGEINIGKTIIESRKDPKKMAWLAAKIGGMAIAPFVAVYYWNTRHFPDIWDDIADFEKANYITLIYGNGKDESGKYNQVIKFPKGDWNYFIDPIQDFLEWSRGNQKEIFEALANDTFFDFIPLSSSPQESFLKTAESSTLSLLPPPAKALAESFSNVNFFTGRPIVPRSLEKASPEQQYKSYTPIIAKKIGEIIRVSPLKIQNAIQTTFGGLGKQVLGIAGTVEKPQFVPPTKFIGERFKGALGGQKETRSGEEIKQFEQKMYDRKAVEKRSVQGIWSSLKKARSAEEAEKILEPIKENTNMKKLLKDIIEKEEKGTTFDEERIRQLSPKERADFIISKLKTMKNKEEAKTFLENMKTIGAITQETKNEMRKLTLPQNP